MSDEDIHIVIEDEGSGLSKAELKAAQKAAEGAVAARRLATGAGTCSFCGADVIRRPDYDPLTLTPLDEPVVLDARPSLGVEKSRRAYIVAPDDDSHPAVKLGVDVAIHTLHDCPEQHADEESSE